MAIYKFENALEELANYNHNCICGKYTCGGAKETEQTLSFLMGLKASYSQIHGHVLLMDPILPVNHIFSFF